MTAPAPEAAPTTTWEIVAVDAVAKLATVRFENPYYSGAHLVQVAQPVLDEEGQPTGDEETVSVDRDPNPHAIKTIRIPATLDGGVDQEGFTERLVDQARGVRRRMDAARAEQLVTGALDDLVGQTTPSP